MIIINYLVRETLKKQMAILFILFLFFFCHKLIKILNATLNGEIPINLIFSMLGLGIPEVVQLILPLSLSLGLLVTFGRLYNENEIIAMHACGLKKDIFLKVAIMLAFFTSIILMINIMWAGPWFSRYQEKILAKAKTDANMAKLVQGQFQQTSDGNLVFFLERVMDNNHFYNIFLAQPRKKYSIRPSIIVANSGWIKNHKDGSQIITLNKGVRFEGTALLRNFRITDFQRYQARIKDKIPNFDVNNTDQMNIHTLWNINNNRARAELHWRITLICSVFMMSLIAVPLSKTDPRQEYMPSIIIAVLLYLIFFLLQTCIKSNASKGEIDPVFYTWLVNAAYLFLSIVLNLKDTMTIRHIRDFISWNRKYNESV